MFFHWRGLLLAGLGTSNKMFLVDKLIGHLLWWLVSAISSFRYFAAKYRHAKRRKDQITPREKTKRRNNAARKDEKTK